MDTGSEGPFKQIYQSICHLILYIPQDKVYMRMILDDWHICHTDK